MNEDDQAVSSSEESPPASPAEDLYQDQHGGSPMSLAESLESTSNFVTHSGMFLIWMVYHQGSCLTNQLCTEYIENNNWLW